MALSKQAKTLNKNQIGAVLNHLAGRRNALRNQAIFLLSVKAGLRAKEIAYLRWEMVLDADGTLSVSGGWRAPGSHLDGLKFQGSRSSMRSFGWPAAMASSVDFR